MATSKPKFEIVVGTSTKSPEAAAKDAENKARIKGGEQVSISSSVVFADTSWEKALNKQMDNIAKNIYQLVQCSCKSMTIIGETIKKSKHGVPPSIMPLSGGPTSSILWVVYILLKH